MVKSNFLQGMILLLTVLLSSSIQADNFFGVYEVRPVLGTDPDGRSMIRMVSSWPTCGIVEFKSRVKYPIVLAAFEGVVGRRRDGATDFRGKLVLQPGETIKAKFDWGKPHLFSRCEYWVYVENVEGTATLDAGAHVYVEHVKENLGCLYLDKFAKYGPLKMNAGR
jgi:hypothetical protein